MLFSDLPEIMMNKERKWLILKIKSQLSKNEMRRSRTKLSRLTMVRLVNLIKRLKDKSMILQSKWQKWMKILIRCSLLVKKNWSMSLSWWLGSRIVPVLRRPSKRKSTILKLSKPEWKEKWRHNSKNLSSNSRHKLSRMLKEIFKKLSEISIMKIRNSPRRPWVNDIILSTTREKSQSLMEIRKIKTEISTYSKKHLINMNPVV